MKERASCALARGSGEHVVAKCRLFSQSYEFDELVQAEMLVVYAARIFAYVTPLRATTAMRPVVSSLPTRHVMTRLELYSSIYYLFATYTKRRDTEAIPPSLLCQVRSRTVQTTCQEGLLRGIAAVLRPLCTRPPACPPP